VIGENIEVVTALAGEPLPVRADRGQLAQVITNLAVNARDAMPNGGVITIRAASANGDAGRTAVLTVSDEGTGMDPATAARIFEPFFTTKGDHGSGLGLATVYGIVAQTGGEVTFETTPGSGTTFDVSLPLDASGISLETGPATEDEEDVEGAGTERILLVEDDPMVRSIVTTMLAAHGYDVVAAATGTEAIETFEARTTPIDLVLTDLVMRGLDGQETIERIRELEPATNVLYMSGYTDDSVIRSGPLDANTGFIQKPFSGDELASQVRRLLDAA
jgi:CheY-like chemotaxis protein